MRDRRYFLAAGLLALSTEVAALGLGAISSHSGLHQPLDATIPLLGAVDEERLQVTLAPPDAFDRAGIPYPPNARGIAFTVGNGMIRITSSKPIREPIVDLLLEIHAPEGRLVREYSLLLDPPRSIYRGPRGREDGEGRALAKGPVPKPRRAMQPPPPGVVLEGSYAVRPGDTLGRVAKRIGSQPGLNARQLADAIFAGNPDAFIDGDPDRLRAGVTLRVPAGGPIAEERALEPAAGSPQPAPRPAAAGAPQGGAKAGLTIVPPPGEVVEALLSESQRRNEELERQNRELRDRLDQMDERLKVITDRLLVLTDPRRQPLPADGGTRPAPLPERAAAPAGGVPPAGAQAQAPLPTPAPVSSPQPAVEAPTPAPVPQRAEAPVAEEAARTAAPGQPQPPAQGRTESGMVALLPWAALAIGVVGAGAFGFLIWRRSRAQPASSWSAHWDE